MKKKYNARNIAAMLVQITLYLGIFQQCVRKDYWSIADTFGGFSSLIVEWLPALVTVFLMSTMLVWSVRSMSSYGKLLHSLLIASSMLMLIPRAGILFSFASVVLIAALFIRFFQKSHEQWQEECRKEKQEKEALLLEETCY